MITIRVNTKDEYNYKKAVNALLNNSKIMLFGKLWHISNISFDAPFDVIMELYNIDDNIRFEDINTEN